MGPFLPGQGRGLGSESRTDGRTANRVPSRSSLPLSPQPRGVLATTSTEANGSEPQIISANGDFRLKMERFVEFEAASPRTHDYNAVKVEPRFVDFYKISESETPSHDLSCHQPYHEGARGDTRGEEFSTGHVAFKRQLMKRRAHQPKKRGPPKILAEESTAKTNAHPVGLPILAIKEPWADLKASERFAALVLREGAQNIAVAAYLMQLEQSH
mmetsp:Transcript_22394/g.59493  ORF Transcript_22394/g.59493 Transcript_22394/m.59493 type:complete len:214 (-) Transcript_22394:1742-2383(-)